MKENRFNRMFRKVLPILYDNSILAGFLLSYGLFFIRPVFFNHEHTMKFSVYVPSVETIGLDLTQMLSYCTSFFVDHGTPYIGNNLYPPFATVFFSPLLLLDNFTAYKVLTLVTMSAYLLTALIIPVLVCKNDKQRSILVLLFVTGLFSYGFHFELERGQFNLIAFSLSMFAVYLFHFQPRFRFLSYALLTISIQLKVFSIILLITLVDNWVDWRSNLKRFSGVVLINISLLFVLGYQIFQDFIKAISGQALNPHMTIYNHSINVFVELLTRKAGYRSFFLDRGMKLSQLKTWTAYTDVAQLLLQIITAVCLIVILLYAIKMRSTGFNSYLVAACTIIMLLIPSVSNDYKLPLVVGPMAIVFQEFIESKEKTDFSLAYIMLMFIGSFVYSTTLFSYTNKPLILDNNMPSLLIMLVVVTIMSIIKSKKQVLVHA